MKIDPNAPCPFTASGFVAMETAESIRAEIVGKSDSELEQINREGEQDSVAEIAKRLFHIMECRKRIHEIRHHGRWGDVAMLEAAENDGWNWLQALLFGLWGFPSAPVPPPEGKEAN